MTTEVLRTLYKKDSKGNLRILCIESDKGDLIQTSGLFDGKKVEHRKTCKPKNIGKANETNSQEQALAEGLALIKKKLREGYFATEKEALNEKVLLPMLAKNFDDESHKIHYPCYVQPKLDGMRALKVGSKLISRKNVEIDTMNHIAKQLTGMGVLDGELYAHGLSFQENMKLIKKVRPESFKVKYHVYDFISNKPFHERLLQLRAAIEKCSDVVELVPTYIISDEEQLKEYHERFIEEGYEGTIVRWGDAGYKVNGRSENLLKYKDFKDIACEVVDIVPNDADPNQSTVVCKLDDGQLFKCGMKFSHSERAEILENKNEYIGTKAEVRFFQLSDTGIPRFPVCYGFRLDK